MTIDLPAIKARCDAATGETWVPDPHDPAGENTVYIVADPETIIRCDHRATREFVENAKQDIPALIAEVERLRLDLEICKGEQDAEIIRANTAEAERDKLRAEVEAFRSAKFRGGKIGAGPGGPRFPTTFEDQS